MFAALFAEFARDPGAMPVTRVALLRLLAGDLGLSPSHSNRVQRS
jgi:hypothetical protein